MSLSLNSVYHTMEQTVHSIPQEASLILIEEAFLILILIGEANFIFILILIFTNANAYPLSLSLSRFLHLYSHNGGFLCSHCHSRQLSVVSVPCLLEKKLLAHLYHRPVTAVLLFIHEPWVTHIPSLVQYIFGIPRVSTFPRVALQTHCDPN